MIELRTLTEPLQFRATEEGLITAHGYAYVFGKRSEMMGGLYEVILPGAGVDDAGNVRAIYGDVRALLDHDPSKLLGRQASGTLRLGEDETGGWYEVDLPDTTVGRDVARLLERGDLSGSSFGFRALMDGVRLDEDDDGLLVRTLSRFAIRDVGPVTFPAYPDTSAALRSIAHDLGTDHLDSLDQARGLIAPAQIGPVRHRRVYPV